MVSCSIMKLSFESIFNDNGGAQNADYRHRFLAQRKWIILCATFVFLLTHKFIAFFGNAGAIQLDISDQSILVLRATSGTGLLFGSYMFFSAYAYVQKYAVQKREQFGVLQIEDRDTFSEKISATSKQIDEIYPELQERKSTQEKLEHNLKSTKHFLNQLSNRFPEVADTIRSEPKLYRSSPLSRTPDKTNLRTLLEEMSAVEGPPPDPKILEQPDWEPDEAARLFREQHRSLGIIERRLNEEAASFSSLQSEVQSLRDEITSAEKGRLEVTKNNRGRWRFFFVFSLLADIVSMIPSLVGLVYCAIEFRRSFVV